MEENSLKGSIEYIREAFKIYFKKENFIFFAKIMFVLVLLTASADYLFSYFFPERTWVGIQNQNPVIIAVFVLLSIASVVLGLWSQTIQYVAILKIGESEKEVFKSGSKNVIKFFLVSLAFGLIVVLGLVLLIIPAVVFGVWYSFSIWLALDKEMKTGEALKTSKSLVKGKFWKIFGRLIVFWLFTLLISIAIGVVPLVGNLILLFVAPLFMLPFYLLYKDLLAENEITPRNFQ